LLVGRSYHWLLILCFDLLRKKEDGVNVCV